MSVASEIERMSRVAEVAVAGVAGVAGEKGEVFACPLASRRCLPLVSFNHITREVRDLRASEHFYCSLLGFRRIARPELGVEGVWVFHDQASISVHLLQGNPPLADGARMDP